MRQLLQKLTAGRPRFGRRRLGKRRRDEGFNLVVLVVMFTVMNIMLAKAMPSWSGRIQREKEKEVIFRGLQYAEAVRVFRLRFNRAPVKLEELVKVEPRSIRQLWNNPLSQEAAGQRPAAIGWEPIFEGQPNVPQPDGQPRRDQNSQSGNTGSGFSGSGALGAGSGKEIKTGPILGVRSTVGDEAFVVWYDSGAVQEWEFTTEVLQPRALASDPALPLPPNAAELGRPWPPGINPPIGQRPQRANPGQRGQNLGGNQQQGGNQQPRRLPPGQRGQNLGGSAGRGP